MLDSDDNWPDCKNPCKSEQDVNLAIRNPSHWRAAPGLTHRITRQLQFVGDSDPGLHSLTHSLVTYAQTLVYAC